MLKGLLIILVISLLASCTVGPDYVRPCVQTPMRYKESPTYKDAHKIWKPAEPQDECDRGEWWTVFDNPELDALEERVEVCNQNVAVAMAQYNQALALVAEARSAYYPTLLGTLSYTRQKTPASGSQFAQTSTTSTGVTTGTTTSGGVPDSFFSTYLLQGTASWVPDIWGLVRRQVESKVTSAQASAAQIRAILLSMQATLAEDYFQLRTLDRDQKILDDAVAAYKLSLKLTQDLFALGVASLSDIAQAETQLKTAEVQALDNGINRAQFEHAIAVLMGEAPETFCLPPKLIAMDPPLIPCEVPSELLERRPDIAVAERQMASANANIGVAVAAFYPTITLSGTAGYTANRFKRWFNYPSSFWSIGPQLTETILDGGLRIATVNAARYAYDQTVANYRQVVLTAFQEVEDNLASLRILKSEIGVQKQDVVAAKLALNLLLSQYKFGTAAYTSVIVAQNAAYTSQKTLSDIMGREMVSAVGLITNLGGGWDACVLKATK
jgi:NodT family efflux transporter outer membrane factor (OMF) lipoprotein